MWQHSLLQKIWGRHQRENENNTIHRAGSKLGKKIILFTCQISGTSRSLRGDRAFEQLCWGTWGKWLLPLDQIKVCLIGNSKDFWFSIYILILMFTQHKAKEPLKDITTWWCMSVRKSKDWRLWDCVGKMTISYKHKHIKTVAKRKKLFEYKLFLLEYKWNRKIYSWGGYIVFTSCKFRDSGTKVYTWPEHILWK